MKLSPKSEALAFRIWAYAEPKGWDVLLADVAKDLNISIAQARWVVTAKRWNSRFRGLNCFDPEIGANRLRSFDAYDGGSYRATFEELVGCESNERMM
jgi:hypothetical protein